MSTEPSYLDVDRTDDDGNVYYFAQTSAALPDAISLTIPGDVFPAFSGVSFGPVPTFSLTSPSLPLDMPITEETAFVWQAGSDDSIVSLAVSSFDAATSETVSVVCNVEDDGAFSFSAETQAELGADFEAQFLIIGRIAYRVEEKDDALLVLMNLNQERGIYLGSE